MDFFSQKKFHWKFWIFLQNLLKEKFMSKIFKRMMDLTNGQLFHRKVHNSDGLYQWNEDLLETKISQNIKRQQSLFESLDFFAFFSPVNWR